MLTHLSGGVFGGWQIFNGDQAETHALNYSDGGKVGLACIGGIGQDGNAIIWNLQIMV